MGKSEEGANQGEKLGKRRTILEARFPGTPESVALAQEWLPSAVNEMLGFVWRAYDRIVGDILSRISLDDADKDLERAITMTLEPRIRDEMSSFESYYVQHERYEHETMLDPPAQPPQYDICFVLRGNERVMWPLEAKVLRTDGAVAAYVADVKGQFLTCRYGPFVDSGAMIGYLVSGDPRQAFNNIAEKVPCKLNSHPDFPERDHRTSDHQRTVPPGKIYPQVFRCHHMLMRLANAGRPERAVSP